MLLLQLLIGCGMLGQTVVQRLLLTRVSNVDGCWNYTAGGASGKLDVHCRQRRERSP
jgi:hypothetical protein